MMMIIIIPELTKPFVISTLKVQKQTTESPTHSFSVTTQNRSWTMASPAALKNCGGAG